MSTKITVAELNNFQKVSYAKIEPSGNVIVLAGKNGAGKTSTNDALESGLCGHNGRNIKPPAKISLHVFNDIEQGSEEWHAVRRGIVTASVVDLLITTKTLKVANNDTARSLTAALVAERITGYTEPSHTSRDMERGTLDEPYARDEYSKRHAPATEVGFMVRDDFGFSIGYSPDGLVGSEGLIEIKSRKQKIQLKAFLDDEVPTENMAQIQTGLLVSGRKWCDYVSYCGGMPLYVKRVFPDPNWHAAIIAAVAQFEANAADMIDTYLARTAGNPPVERIDHYLDLELKL